MVLVHQSEARRGRWLAAAAVVAAAFAVGLLVGFQGGREVAAEVELTGPLAPPVAPLPPSLAQLTALEVELDPAELSRLQRLRDSSLAEGFLVTSDDSFFDARVRLGDERAEARVRLKGDLTDHIDTGKWSLRIEVTGGATLGGMSSFSIQHPKTRGFLMEWLMMTAARREGLLAPRGDFVAVTVNGNDSGAYYLEEHFTKELLESQGRRDGPIVRFREDTFWAALRQHNAREMGFHPQVTEAAFLENAELGAYGGGRLSRQRSMDLRLQRALDQLRAVQWRMAAARGQPREAMAAAQALEDARAQAVDQVFASEPMGRMLALYSLFRCVHGLAWHQLRFYHDPVRDLLEPVVFDTGADFAGETEDLAVSLPELEPLLASDEIYEAAYAAMERMGQPSYLRELAAAVQDDLRRYAAVLFDEGLLPLDVDPVHALQVAFGPQARLLRNVARPADPANFFAIVTAPPGAAADDTPVVHLEAWSTTAAPVLLRGFRFSNGRFVRAAAFTAGDSDLEGRRRPDGALALPRDGRRLKLKVPLDSRLWALRDIQSIKEGIRSGLGPDHRVKADVQVEMATVGGTPLPPEPLILYRRHRIEGEGGRPPTPSFDEVLRQHPFLSWDWMADELRTAPGEHVVDGDLLLPPHATLILTAGTTLRFAPDAVLWARGPLHAEGTAEAPVTIEPAAGASRFSGILVTDAVGPSVWRHAVVRRADALARGGWQTTGGVTFFGSPCELYHCRFEAAPGEDALNPIRCAITVEDCVFRGGAADLFDGDFVRGVVRRCRFEDAGEDALDFSGSNVEIRDCVFAGIGDKALSLGEGTVAEVLGCEVEGAAIALAAKDHSSVVLEQFTVGRVEQYHLAVFVKKSEFGPATVAAKGLTLGPAGRGRYLVQEGCTLTVDGVAVPGEPVDVKALYRERILGK